MAKLVGKLLIYLLVAVIGLEAIGAVYYFLDRPLSRPPWLGGAALQLKPAQDSFSFDPVTLYANSAIPLNEGLYARAEIDLPPKAPEEYRVFVVGGSTVADIRLAPGTRMADWIGRSMTVQGKVVRSYNMGVPSYTSYNELQLVIGKLIQHAPDMVVVFDGANDTFYGSVMRSEVAKPNLTDVGLHYRNLFRVAVQQQGTPRERLQHLLEGSSYAAFMAADLGREEEPRRSAAEHARALAEPREAQCAAALPLVRTPNPTFADEARVNSVAVDAYVTNLRAVAAALQANDIRLVHVLQPTAFTKKTRGTCEQYAVALNDFLYAGMSKVFPAVYELYRPRLAAVAQDYPGAVFADLSRFTDDRPEYLFDDTMHSRHEGTLARLLGQEIAAIAARHAH